MNLNKRLVLLIIPVTLLSYALAIYNIYQQERSVVADAQQQKITLELSELSGYYNESLTFMKNYLYSLKQRGLISRFLNEEYNEYSELELNESLEDALVEMGLTESSFTSLALLSAQQYPLFYYENSLDPFAAISPLQMEFVKTGVEHKLLSQSGIINYDSDTALLIKYILIDSRTLMNPLPHQINYSLALVIATDPYLFNKKIQLMNGYYETKIEVTKLLRPLVAETEHRIRLSDGMYIYLQPSAHYNNAKVERILVNLFSAFLIMSILTTAVLLVLIKYYVINPVGKLDRELTELDNHQRDNISYSHAQDEVGRVSRKFFNLYKDLNFAYLQSKQLAENDQLTQLPNRYLFNKNVEQVLAECKRAETALSIIYIDLDNFKFVNDKYGHDAGDKLLIAFSQQLQSLVAEQPSQYNFYCQATRLSGDEFAIAVSADNLPALEVLLTDAILEWFKFGYQIDLGTYPVTASIGIGRYPEHGSTLDQLISKADSAMYQAKKQGKNQLCYYSQTLDAQIQRVKQVESELRKQPFDREFSLVYMPFVAGKDKSLKGFEALVRWHSPTLGFVGPDEFIPIAENIGLYQEVDRWVIRHAMANYHAISAHVGNDFQLSINISSANLNSATLADEIIALAQEYQVAADCIEFEITETFEAGQYHDLLLAKLREYGFNLAIDDFGSGYTSITQLVQYPVQKIKFDRLFLNTLIAEDKQQIIKPLIDLCHSQSMLVTAEGIENEAMSTWLTDYQCDLLQGYHYGQPMTLAKIPTWLANYQHDTV